ALAGARVLYLNGNATSVNAGANQTAHDAAIANLSEGVPVEVNWTAGSNGADVERGHWSFATETFTPNASLVPVDLWGVSTAELDANTDFINAVRVTVRRQDTAVASFFARIFGIEEFLMSAHASAYIGFAGSLLPGEADQPIAICEDSILDNGVYDCNIGRMINSGQNVESNETGGWTSFDQETPCTGGTNAQEVSGLICSGGAPALTLGRDLATNGGQIQSAFSDLYDCWTNESGQSTAWNMLLPVVTCPGNNITTCQELVGAVNVNVVWITGPGEDPSYSNAPTSMTAPGSNGNTVSWSSSDPDGMVRWDSFVNAFGLQNVDGSPAPYQKKGIYFLPDCTPHDPAGLTGGRNFGILAEIPVLVD
ncbi:MAG: hypothetical protein JJV98_04935, partial [Desulfosarcina sp.]|nr:hypothetical protein [Desulfobacterales bacterium]